MSRKINSADDFFDWIDEEIVKESYSSSMLKDLDRFLKVIVGGNFDYREREDLIKILKKFNELPRIIQEDIADALGV